MAGDWIKIENVTPDKPEVFQIAEALDIDPDAVTGKLIRIWIWADQQTTDGNARGVTRSLLDRLSGVKGFADALIAVGWLDETDDGLEFVNFGQHNGETAKKRALTARRVARHKEKKRQGNGSDNAEGNAAGVTNALPREEKRRVNDSSSTGDPSLFVMNMDWQPGEGFCDRLKMAGINPAKHLTTENLIEFKSYWRGQDRIHSHAQWEHKLLQALQRRNRHDNGNDSGQSGNGRSGVARAIDDIGDTSWMHGFDG